MDERFLWYCTILAPPNLVCDSMSTIGIWELHAMPSWREPPPETLIPWHWSELGTACYAFVAGATSESQFYWGMGAACYAFVREPPPESLSSYTSPLGAHHSSPMPLGRVFGVDEMMAFGTGYWYANHVVIFPWLYIDRNCTR